MKSYIQDVKECYLCRKLYDVCTDTDLHEHHVYEGWANRSVSEKMGAKIFLCGRHHNLSDQGIHFNKDIDLEVKKEAQRLYEKNHTREEFMELIGRNYL